MLSLCFILTYSSIIVYLPTPGGVATEKVCFGVNHWCEPNWWLTCTDKALQRQTVARQMTE